LGPEFKGTETDLTHKNFPYSIYFLPGSHTFFLQPKLCIFFIVYRPESQH